MNTNIASLYEFTLQQMAAESYFEGISLNAAPAVKRQLLLGTNREGYPASAGTTNTSLNEGFPGYTRMTSVQADEFLNKYQVVHQWSDNPTPTGSRPAAEGVDGKPKLNSDILANTGLSATLIRKRDTSGVLTDEYTLAIRSTEFRSWADGGDGERDKTAADINSIGFKGFTLAQLDALEQYYQWVKDNQLLPVNAQLNVTGYSLGGQLATVFTEIHQSDSDIHFGQTVTFNGAGRGSFNASAGSMKDMIDYYHQVLNDPRLAPDPGGGIATAQRGAAIGKLGQAFDEKSVYNDERYAWAMTATQLKFGLTFLGLSDENRTGTLADSRITQMYGYETLANTNFTANSGIHGPALKVGIESQPLLEGIAGGFLGAGDFGSGHSISLLADSLALQRTIKQLDASYDLNKFISLLPATTNKKVTNGTNANYEADALENVLDAVRRAVVGTSVTKTEFKDGASGFGDITKREGYYANLKALTDSAAFKSLEGKILIRPTSADLKSAARNSFGALVALQDLSPVWLAGKDSAADATLATVWQSTRASDYAAWQADKSAATPSTFTDNWIADRAALLQAVLSANVQNAITTNPDGYLAVQGTPNSDSNTRYIDLGSSKLIQVNNARISPSTAPNKYIMFGDDSANILNGRADVDHLYGGSGDDELNGKGGDDYLEGGAGTDTYAVEANAGQDTILDTDGQGQLKFAGRTLNGTGTLVSDTAAQAIWKDTSQADAVIDYVWNKTSKELRISGGGALGAGSSVIIKNYSATPANGATSATGTLGIAAPAAAPIVVTPPASNIIDVSTSAGWESYTKQTDAQGNTTLASLPARGAVNVTGAASLNAATANLNFLGSSQADVIEGGAQMDFNPNYAPGKHTLHGLGGDDKIYAVTAQTVEEAISNSLSYNGAGAGMQAATLDGGAGDDTLIGSALNDVIYGGDGKDTIVGGAGNDIIMSDGDAPILSVDGVNRMVGDTTLPDGPSTGNHSLLGASRLYSYTLRNDSSPGNGQNSFPFTYTRFLPGFVVTTFEYNSTAAGYAGQGYLADYVDPLGSYDFTGIASLQNQVLSVDNWGRTIPEARNRDATLTVTGSNLGPKLPSWYGLASTDPQNNPLINPINAFNTNRHSGDDVVYAGAGNDIVNAGGGQDLVLAGDGTDYVAGYGGDDFLFGEDGNDFLWGDEAVQTTTGLGRNVTDVWSGVQYATAGLAGDAYGQDYLDGGNGNDVLVGGGNYDELLGGEGDDWLYGDNANDQLSDALSGSDRLDGGAGNDKLYGNAGDDVLEGGTDNDLLSGGKGDDYLDGGEGLDVLQGDSGNDQLFGGADNDTLDGGDGNDYLDGEGGSNNLIGGDGNDTLVVHQGDTADGGAGNDTYLIEAQANISDSQGANTFQFTNINASQAGSTITQLTTSSQDKIIFAAGSASEQEIPVIETVTVSGQQVPVLRWGSNRIALPNISQSAGTTVQLEGGLPTSLGYLLSQSNIIFNTNVQQAGAIVQTGQADDTVQINASGVRVNAGAGNDKIVVRSADAVVELFAIDGSQTSQGTDSIELQGADNQAPAFVTVDLGEGVDLATVTNNGFVLTDQGTVQTTLSWSINGTHSVNLSMANTNATALQDLVSRVTLKSGSNTAPMTSQLATGILFTGSSRDDLMQGTASADNLSGAAGDDVIDAGGGDDTIDIAQGFDSVNGGSGKDFYVIRNGGSANITDSGGEINRIKFTDIESPSQIALTRVLNDLVLTTPAVGDVAGSSVVIKGFGTNSLGFSQWELDVGGHVGHLADVLTDAVMPPLGSYGAFKLNAQIRLDKTNVNDYTIEGTASNDQIVLGDRNSWAGVARLNGDDGNDTLIARSILTQGMAALKSYFVSYPRAQSGSGTFLDGGNGSDTLIGTHDDDVLDGGAGADMLLGGGGGDVYAVTSGDVVADLAVGRQDQQDTLILPTDVNLSDIRVEINDWLPEGVNATAGLKAVSLHWGVDQSVTVVVTSDFLQKGRMGSSPRVELPYDPGYSGTRELFLATTSAEYVGSFGIEKIKINGETLDFAEVLRGLNVTGLSADSNADEYLFGTSADDVLIGSGGADTLVGADGNDVLIGDKLVAFDDVGSFSSVTGETQINGTLGGPGDIFVGGRGDDIGWLTQGADTIRFNMGDGIDSYLSWEVLTVPFAYGSGRDLLPQTVGEIDTILLGGGLRVSDVRLSTVNEIASYYPNARDSMIVTFSNSSDKLIFKHGSGLRLQFKDATSTDPVSFVVAAPSGGDLQGTSVNDVLVSAGENDRMIGGSGSDTYHVGLGQRYDTIVESGADTGFDVLKFGNGITAANMQLSREGNDIYLSYQAYGPPDIYGYPTYISGSVNLQNALVDTGTVERIEFADGTVWGREQLLERLPPNRPPVLSEEVPTQVAMDGEAWTYVLPTGIFSDPDGDALTYQVNTSDGAPLPTWLAFDPVTRSLSGQPNAADVGSLTLKVIGTDVLGASSATSFSLIVEPPHGIVLEGHGTLVGTKYDDLIFSNGYYGSHFIGGAGNDVMRVIAYGSTYWSYGNLFEGGLGDDEITGSYANDTYLFGLGDGHDTITDDVQAYYYGAQEFSDDPTNPFYQDNLILGSGISLQDLTVTQVDYDMVILIAGGDSITIKNWFDGTIFNKIEQITFADGSTLSAGSLEQLLIVNNRAPVLAIPIGAQQTIEGSSWSFSIPVTTFIDADNDPLTLTARLTNGDLLPTWLSFDAVTKIFSGTPPETASGMFDITVTATDNHGASASTSFSLEIANLIAGTALDDVLTGTVGNDAIVGGLGADRMTGGKGNDVYYVDNVLDKVIEKANEGRDTVHSTITHTLAANVEDLVLDGTAVIDGTGNALDNRIEGNAADNKLMGGDGSDTLLGGAGDDWLRGGTGSDTLVGGLGDDLYEVDNAGDVVVEGLNEGVDTVEASVTCSLSANVENLILTGTLAIDGTGNDLDNTLQGNDAANVLTGGAGDDTLDGKKGLDTLIGGLGNDTYLLEDDVDTVVELAGEGRDTVISQFAFTLAVNIEDGILLGSAASITGNELANVLTGNSAANTIDGGAGADVMVGGKGNDTYIVDNQADTVIENAGEGTDTVLSSVNYALADNVENLTLTGTAEAGMGNSLNNKITGNVASNKLFGGVGNDEIDGGAGADIMIGGLGNDKYWVDSSSDLVVEAVGEGTDTVYASVSYALADNVENLVLTGSANINAVGNAGNNRIEGNAGNNILFGGLGNDTYVFGRGSGRDIVANFDAGKPSGDMVQLGAGIADADLNYLRAGNDLVLSIKGTNDQLTIASYFENGGKGANALEKIRFADGTSLNHAAVLSRSTVGTGSGAVSDAQSLPAGVSTGNPTALFDAPTPEATKNSDATLTPQSVAESINAARERFEDGLKSLKLGTDEQGSLSRSEFAERRTLPLLWNLQDALLNLQLAKNADGRFTADVSIDSRATRDLGLGINLLGATTGRSGRLDQVARPAEIQQFDLAQLH